MKRTKVGGQVSRIALSRAPSVFPSWQSRLKAASYLSDKNKVRERPDIAGKKEDEGKGKEK